MKLPALYVLSAIFCILLIMRTVGVSAEVLVPEGTADETNKAEVSEMNLPSDGSNAVDSKDSASQCLTGDVLEVLQTDRAKLDERLSNVKTREQTLATLETKLNAQMTQIEAANNALQERIELMASTANEDIEHLVKMYQVMKPKQAAEIFDSMDPSFAAGFLREMNSERAGMIMANMDSRKSYSISVIMAAKNAKYR